MAKASSAEDLAKELRRELHPEVAINTATRLLHTARFGMHLVTTALACGWSWTGSSDKPAEAGTGTRVAGTHRIALSGRDTRSGQWAGAPDASTA